VTPAAPGWAPTRRPAGGTSSTNTWPTGERWTGTALRAVGGPSTTRPRLGYAGPAGPAAGNGASVLGGGAPSRADWNGAGRGFWPGDLGRENTARRWNRRTAAEVGGTRPEFFRLVTGEERCGAHGVGLATAPSGGPTAIPGVLHQLGPAVCGSWSPPLGNFRRPWPSRKIGPAAGGRLCHGGAQSPISGHPLTAIGGRDRGTAHRGQGAGPACVERAADRGSGRRFWSRALLHERAGGCASCHSPGPPRGRVTACTEGGRTGWSKLPRFGTGRPNDPSMVLPDATSTPAVDGRDWSPKIAQRGAEACTAAKTALRPRAGGPRSFKAAPG